MARVVGVGILANTLLKGGIAIALGRGLFRLRVAATLAAVAALLAGLLVAG